MKGDAPPARGPQDDDGLMRLIESRNEDVTPTEQLGQTDFRSNHKAFRNMVRGAAAIGPRGAGAASTGRGTGPLPAGGGETALN